MKITVLKTKRQELKRKLTGTLRKFTEGLTLPKTKFIFNFIQGILSSDSTRLALIANGIASSNKNTSDEIYLSRNLKSFDIEQLEQNEINYYKSILPKNVTLILDKSDIAKPSAKSMENITKIQDGSDEYKTKNGYYTSNILTFTNFDKPIFLCSKVNNCSKSTQTEDDHNLIDYADKILSNYKRTYIVDSGYSGEMWINQFIENKDLFITRSAKNRKFYFNGNEYHAEELSELQKQDFFKYKIMPVKIKNQKGAAKISFTTAKVNGVEEKLTIVIVNSTISKPMILITNMKCKNIEDAIHIYYKYLKRWTIENGFKFIKQQFKLEDFRIRKFKSIENLYHFVLLIFNIISLFLKTKDSEIIKYLITISKPLKTEVKFCHYRVAEGIKIVLANAKNNIYKYF